MTLMLAVWLCRLSEDLVFEQAFWRADRERVRLGGAQTAETLAGRVAGGGDGVNSMKRALMQ